MGSDRKQQEKRTKDFFAIGDQQVREVYIDFLSWRTSIRKKMESGGVPCGHNPPGRTRLAWGTLVSCAHQGTLHGSFFISKIVKYSKTNKKYFCGFFGVRLLSVSHTSLFSRFWSVPEGLFYVFFRCQSLDNITFNINGRT